jgi:type VII secretion integral membrane protein EccD
MLTRLVVHAPGRRLDVAFPAHVPVVSVLPVLLRRAGDDLADGGLNHDGWVLRRGDGAVLDPSATFAGQRVRDGEALFLVPRRLEWPEAEYDDIVDAIAEGAQRRGRRWSGNETRVAGLAAAGIALASALAELLRDGPPWGTVAVVAGTVAVVLLGVGAVLARAVADAATGAVVAAFGLPFAFVTGLVVLAEEPLGRLGAPHVLLGSALAAGAAVLGYAATAAYGRVFVAGATAGASGVAGGLVALFPLGAVEVAALLAGVLLLTSPMLPALAVRLGRIPLPELPRTPEDLVADRPLPDRRTVTAATVRADEALTGLLLGTTGVAAACLVILAATRDLSAVLLTVAVSVSLLLRGRFYVGLRHRVPLLVAGTVGLVAVGEFALERPALPAYLVIAAVGVAAGLAYSRRPVSPRLGRLADVFDVLLTLAVVPLACAVLGLFGVMRGFFG